MKSKSITCQAKMKALLYAFCVAVTPGVAADVVAMELVSAHTSQMAQGWPTELEGTIAITSSFNAVDAGLSYQDVKAWITAHSPEHAPLLPEGKVTITRHIQFEAGQMSTMSEGPPMALPGSGTPGENITLTQTHPDGSFETWSYTWESGGSGGGWVLMEYHFKKNNDPVNVQ